MDRPRRAAHDPAPLAREAAARGRAGRSAGAGAIRDHLAGRRQAPARRRCAARRDRTAAGCADCRLDHREPRFSRRASTRTTPATSTRSWRPERSSGLASSRSANATEGLRCISPITLRSCLPPEDVRLKADATRTRDTTAAAILDYLDAHGASFFGQLHEAAGGGYPGGNGRGLVGPRLARPRSRTTRSTRCARSPRRERRAGVSSAQPRAVFRSRRLVPPAAEGRWSLVRRAESKSSTTRWATRRGPTAVEPAGHPDTRGRRQREPAGRLRRRLSRAEGDGGTRPDPTRVFRRRARRDAVRAPGRSRSAAVASDARRRAGSRRAVSHRPIQSVRHGPQGAGVRPGRTARLHAHGRRVGDPCRRHAGRVSRSGRPAAVDVASRD